MNYNNNGGGMVLCDSVQIGRNYIQPTVDSLRDNAQDELRNLIRNKQQTEEQLVNINRRIEEVNAIIDKLGATSNS